MAEVGPISLDSKNSQDVKQEKLKEEAQCEKERGNAFVKLGKWDEAISCYNRAIGLVNDDAIYYANRGLCYLKKDCLHQAESDCTEALNLDPTYVKALQRRATARERLGSLRAASQDLVLVLNLEPHNSAAKKQLDAIRARMGTKGTKSKSSPTSTPVNEGKPSAKARSRGKAPVTSATITTAAGEARPAVVKRPSQLDLWRDGVGEGITVIKPVKKPPHLRSKRQLKSIPIREIRLGDLLNPDKRYEIDNNRGDYINNGGDKHMITPGVMMMKGKGDGDISSPESVKLANETSAKSEKQKKYLTPPVTSVQFMAEWKYLKGRESARSAYLSNIDPEGIPRIFENALESEVVSDVIRLLHDHVDSFEGRSVTAYLKALCRVKRFSALAMFLSRIDKEYLTELLIHCKVVERCNDDDIEDLKRKFEL